MLYRRQGKGERVVLVGQAILLQREGTPAVNAAQAHLYFVDEDISQVGLFYFVGVALNFPCAFVQGFDGVV